MYGMGYGVPWIPGKIFALDYTPHKKLSEWQIQRDSNGKPTTEFVSRQMVWYDLD